VYVSLRVCNGLISARCASTFTPPVPHCMCLKNVTSFFYYYFFFLSCVSLKLQNFNLCKQRCVFHTEKANKMQQCIKIYYSAFIRSSTCYGRHTAHHQELKTALAASAFAYARGCWTLSASNNLNVQQPLMYAKPEPASAVLSS
jgi:hypothetical protein